MIIDKKDFQEIGKKLQEYETNRDLVIKKSRDIIKISKQIIYSVHRNELNEELIKKIKQEKTKLEKDLKKYPGLYFEGSFKVAIQEYVEALLYFYFVKNKNSNYERIKCRFQILPFRTLRFNWRIIQKSYSQRNKQQNKGSFSNKKHSRRNLWDNVEI